VDIATLKRFHSWLKVLASAPFFQVGIRLTESLKSSFRLRSWDLSAGNRPPPARFNGPVAFEAGSGRQGTSTPWVGLAGTAPP